MLKKLKDSKGDGSVLPITLVILLISLFVMIIFILNLDGSLFELQKDRYIKAVDMAVNTAIAGVELSNDSNGLEATSLELIGTGYENQKRVLINKEKLVDDFYDILLRNMPIKGIDVATLQKHIPLKAILQYDTISVSSRYYHEKDIAGGTVIVKESWNKNNFDNNKKKYNDVWDEIRLGFRTKLGTEVFMTIGDKCYTLIDSTLPEEQLFLEGNREYFSVLDSSVSGVKIIDGEKITLERKNKELALRVQSILREYASSNERGRYNISISDFDYLMHVEDKRIANSINAAKDVTFYCLVEGLPMKSLLNGEKKDSFSLFSYGGTSLKRADE